MAASPDFPCLGNAIDHGAWQGTVHGVTKGSDTTERPNNTKSHSRHSETQTLPRISSFFCDLSFPATTLGLCFPRPENCMEERNQ